MVTLAGEVLYYRRRNAQQQKDDSGSMSKVSLDKNKTDNSDQIMIQKLAAKLQLKPAPAVAFDSTKPTGPKPRVSQISVYPRPFPFKE